MTEEQEAAPVLNALATGLIWLGLKSPMTSRIELAIGNCGILVGKILASFPIPTEGLWLRQAIGNCGIPWKMKLEEFGPAGLSENRERDTPALKMIESGRKSLPSTPMLSFL